MIKIQTYTFTYICMFVCVKVRTSRKVYKKDNEGIKVINFKKSKKKGLFALVFT